MKVWILEIGEPLPLEKDVRLHQYGTFTKYLAAQGHQVTWWSSSFSHAPKKNFADRDTDHEFGNLKLKLIYGKGYKKNISFQRIFHNKHFAKRFRELAHAEPKPDLIVSPIPVIEIGIEALNYAKQNNIPILIHIRDEWPDDIANIAPKPFRPLARLALSNSYKSMRHICQNVTGIMSIAKKQMEYALKFTNRTEGPQDFFFPLGYSETAISTYKHTEGLRWCAENNIKDSDFNVCFFGTLGKFFDIKTIIKVASDPEIQKTKIKFIIAGDGSSLANYKVLAKGLDNILFPGWIDAPKIHAIMSLSKVGIAPYKSASNFSLSNKPFEYMAGGLPILSSIQHELKELLEQSHGGLTYWSDNKQDLKEKLLYLCNNEEDRKLMALNAQKILKDNFIQERIFERAEKYFNKTISNFHNSSPQ